MSCVQAILFYYPGGQGLLDFLLSSGFAWYKAKFNSVQWDASEGRSILAREGCLILCDAEVLCNPEATSFMLKGTRAVLVMWQNLFSELVSPVLGQDFSSITALPLFLCSAAALKEEG